ncbi:zinc transporter ZIP1 isoform X2 [Scaptodrosophila lebanonensis]|nr:zinc transporter ZIP1 isoform X2 [Scaptodrosophila lebanonensis]
MESDFAEVSMCAGFFIVYFIDEFINYFCGGATHHQHAQFVNSSSETVSTRTPTSTQSYGAVDEREPLLASEVASHRNENGNNDPMSSTYICDVPRVEHLNMPTSHINHQEPCVQSMTGTLGLFVALSMHAAIEGLTIGVQNSATKVLFLLGAVACHKFVMGFCLGLELRSSTSIRSQFFGVLVFAFGAILGIGIGMLIVELPTGWSKMSLPIIQALAGGTLFYVTVCEVIPREKARWHQNTGRSAAGLAQFASVGTGFTAMCIINFYLSDGD